MPRIFIDGREGTTGLRIFERLSSRSEMEILTLPEESRKDPAKRREMLNKCDAAFLCLPDATAIESATMVENPNVIVLDASTAHRTNPGWAYGFPELSPAHRSAVQQGKRIAVPGCHASGFVSLVRPLVEAGILPRDAALSAWSLTGYSGGGKKMIAQYESGDRERLLDSPRLYGVTQSHKHLPEMQKVCGLDYAPVFCPIVSDYYSGMLTGIGLSARQLTPGKTLQDVKDAYAALYKGPIVRYAEGASSGGFMASNAVAGSDSMVISVEGNEERFTLLSLFDNLGKGASGAAVECMNLAFGMDEKTGLCLVGEETK